MIIPDWCILGVHNKPVGNTAVPQNGSGSYAKFVPKVLKEISFFPSSSTYMVSERRIFIEDAKV